MKERVAATLVLIMLASGVLGATLLEYEKRVFRAAEQIERIKADPDYEEEAISYLRKLLPASEQVEIEGRKITVDNSWLHRQLDSITAENSEQERVRLLAQTGERLRALDDNLRRAEAEAATEDDASRERIKGILSRSDYRERQEDSLTKLIKEARRRVKEFFLDLYTRIVTAVSGAGRGVSWLFRGLIIAAVLLTLISVARMIQRIGPRKKRQKKRTVLGEEIEEGTTASDLADAAMALAQAGDFRSGVRKLYIAMLYELSERNLIELSPNTTNHEYLEKVSRFAALVPAMRYLTERFDYFWYGMFPSSEADFSTCLARYREAVRCAQSLSGKPA